MDEDTDDSWITEGINALNLGNRSKAKLKICSKTDIIFGNEHFFTGLAGKYELLSKKASLKVGGQSGQRVLEADHVIPQEAYKDALKEPIASVKIKDGIQKIKSHQMSIIIKVEEHLQLKSTGNGGADFRRQIMDMLVRGDFKMAISTSVAQYEAFGQKYNQGIRRIVNYYCNIKLISNIERDEILMKFPGNDTMIKEQGDFELDGSENEKESIEKFETFKLANVEAPSKIAKALQILLDHQMKLSLNPGDESKTRFYLCYWGEKPGSGRYPKLYLTVLFEE